MSDYFLGEIRLFPISYAPKGWLPCEGQLLAITQNQALYSLLGLNYGGNGTTNFQLPDFRGRVPLGAGQAALGSKAGSESVTLTSSQMPAHTHQAQASNVDADVLQPRANSALAVPSGSANAIYKNTNPGTPLGAESLTMAGGSLPHENRQPTIALHFCIATTGIYPSQQ